MCFVSKPLCILCPPCKKQFISISRLEDHCTATGSYILYINLIVTNMESNYDKLYNFFAIQNKHIVIN